MSIGVKTRRLKESLENTLGHQRNTGPHAEVNNGKGREAHPQIQMKRRVNKGK